MFDTPIKAKEFILNAVYKHKYILKLFDINKGFYTRYFAKSFLQPSVRKFEPGLPDLYSFDDLMKIQHFLLLRELGLEVELATKIVNHEKANDYPFGICRVYGDRPSIDLVYGNIKFYPLAATELLCNMIFKTIKLDELEQR